LSELKPLLDSDLPDDLAGVLRSADADGPEDHEPAQTRTLAAVAAHRAAREGAQGRRANTGIPLAKTMVALVVACVGGGALSSTFDARGPVGAEPAPVSAPSPPSAPAALAPALSAPPESPEPVSPEGTRIDELPSARTGEPSRKTAAPAPVRRNGSDVELEDELAIIDSARAALAAKRPETTLAKVEAYRRRFRGGQFNEEADVLEIQALVAMGRRDEANAKGQRFLASHPDSAYKRRAQSALGSEVTP